MADNTNLRSNYVDQLHQSAASGDVKAVLEALKGLSKPPSLTKLKLVMSNGFVHSKNLYVERYNLLLDLN